MASVVIKLGNMLADKLKATIAPIAVLALALGLSGSQAQAPKAPAGATGPKAAPLSTPEENKKLLDRARQLSTEGGRHAAAVDAALEAEKKKAESQKGAPATAATGQKRPPVLMEPGTQRDKGDPFAVPIKPVATVTAQTRPAGQAGLLVAEAQLQGLVKSADSRNNVAIVRAPNGFTYFLKVGDKLYNARVLRVSEDAVYFEETVTDSLGKTTKSEVAKRLASAPPKP